jgi:DNA mismatch repair protein MutS
LAGIPRGVIARAKYRLEQLEDRASQSMGLATAQLPLFETPGLPVLSRLKEIDPERLTPKQALDALFELKSKLAPL